MSIYDETNEYCDMCGEDFDNCEYYAYCSCNEEDFDTCPDCGNDYDFCICDKDNEDFYYEQKVLRGVKYPHITVKLLGNDGNAFAILGNVSKAMKKANVDKEEIDTFMTEAMSGDYNHLLQTVMRYVNVE